MKRPAPEWLVLPVFVLPFAVAALLALAARSSYLATIDGYRRDGAATVRRWLDADPPATAAAAASFDASVRRAAEGWVPFRRGAVTGVVRTRRAVPDEPPWEIAADFPGGLRPDALADAGVRLSIEAGTPIARQPGADAATAAFGRFATGGAAGELRSAPLPAGAKLHLLRRAAGSRDAESHDVASRNAESHDVASRDADTLAALTSADPVLDAVGRGLSPGVHAAGAGVVLVPSSGAPVVVIPDEWSGGTPGCPSGGLPTSPGASRVPPPPPAVPEVRVMDDPTRTAVLVWTPIRGAAARDVAWTGRLDAPLAGTWAIVLPRGPCWWRAAGVEEWLLPVAFACAAFLAIPTALLIALRRRRRLDEARARFINEIAHDLRTPVAALRLHAELLSSGRSPESERGKHVGVLGREAARISSLLANLLDLSRLERGTRPFDRAAVDVSDVVREAVREFLVLYPKRAEDVTVDVPAELTIVADRTALARALANLLDNAGKFTPAGTRISVRAEPAQDGGARIVVADEGPGIAPGERSRVFQPYERGSAAEATAAPGTGLGLALVRDLVEGMGGTVVLDGAPRGATFVVTIPGATDD